MWKVQAAPDSHLEPLAAGTAVACLSVGSHQSRRLTTDAELGVAALLPAIDLIVGPMFAGKSTALLQRLMDLEVRNMPHS